MDKHGIELRTTPHIHAVNDVVVIMRNVVFASLPMAAWSVWLYGLSALLLMITVVASCLLTERLFNLKVGNTLGTSFCSGRFPRRDYQLDTGFI